MNTFWNVLWIFPFCGWLVAILYGFLGLCMCATVVGLPIGLGLLQYSKFLFWPHGNAMISKSDLEVITEEQRPLWWRVFAMIVRIVYLPFGLINAICGVAYGFLCLISIIGIPEGLVMMKSIGTLFNPINKVVVPVALRDEIERKKALRRYSKSSAPQEQVGNNGSQYSERIAEVNLLRKNEISSGFGAVRYCAKCNAPLSSDAVFCSKCGEKVELNMESSMSGVTDVLSSRMVPPIPSFSASSTLTSDETPITDLSESAEDDKDKRKKYLIYGGIGVVVMAIMITILVVCIRKGHNEQSFVFADSATVYKTLDGGVGVDPLADLSYGSPVEYKLSSDGKDEEWIKVSVKEAGKTIHGFVRSSLLIDKNEFDKLEKAGLDDSDIRKATSLVTQRLAVLHALRTKDKWWHLEKMAYTGESEEFNGIPVLVRGATPNERCFAFVLANDSARWDRELYVYSFTDNEKPILLYNEKVGQANGKVRDVSIRNGGYKVLYGKINPDSWMVSPVEEIVEYNIVEGAAEDFSIEEPLQEIPSDVGIEDNGNLLKGKIDDKYDIVMDVTVSKDGEAKGYYYYTSKKVPIELEGKMGANNVLTLKEKVNGEVTGSFVGRWWTFQYFGSWISPDGSKELHFDVKR